MRYGYDFHDLVHFQSSIGLKNIVCFFNCFGYRDPNWASRTCSVTRGYESKTIFGKPLLYHSNWYCRIHRGYWFEWFFPQNIMLNQNTKFISFSFFQFHEEVCFQWQSKANLINELAPNFTIIYNGCSCQITLLLNSILCPVQGWVWRTDFDFEAN